MSRMYKFITFRDLFLLGLYVLISVKISVVHSYFIPYATVVHLNLNIVSMEKLF